jgi:Fur family zinc uptake transcriptional regulator
MPASASAQTSTARLTRNQQEVLTCLRTATDALTAYEILDRVRAAGIVYPPTVYRALNELIQLGMVHRIESYGAFVACRHGPGEHQTALAICRECQRVVEVPLRSDQEAMLQSLSPEEIAIERVTLEFIGLCGSCLPTGKPVDS